MSGDDILLEVRDLRKYFKTPRGMLHAVDDVNLSVERGTTLGVVGESGCGKSTLGRVILGLHEATSGQVLFEGKDITFCRKQDRLELYKDMQMIFQDPMSSLDPRMCVSDLIAEPLRHFKVCRNKGEVQERVRELMDTVGLATRFAYSYPHEMDGGRRQRIGIARALALNPRFIICDEPVSALDVSIQAQILNLLKELQQNMGLTYIFITHDMSVVKHISQKIVAMYLGCVVESCDADELFVHRLHPYTKGLLSAIPVPSIHVTRTKELLKGEITSPIEPKPGCRFSPRCPYATDICRAETPTLEEVLPEHFAACHNVRQINGLI